jgi:hypothetical protein
MIVAAAVNRLSVSAGHLVGPVGRPPFVGRSVAGCAEVAARVCLLGPCVVAGDSSIPVFGAGALAVVVGRAIISWEPPPFTLRIVAGGVGG